MHCDMTLETGDTCTADAVYRLDYADELPGHACADCLTLMVAVMMEYWNVVTLRVTKLQP
jgi:hypothetical protein